MAAAQTVLMGLAVAANGFSGVAALVRFRPVLAKMRAVGVPESWLIFPIGVLKTAGALGLLLGLAGLPLVGPAAAVGLILFFACAVHTHLLARDRARGLVLPVAFLLLATATLAASLAG